MSTHLLWTGAAAAECGISDAQFRTIAKDLGVQPSGDYQNPHYRSGPPCPLWSPEDVATINQSSLAECARKRRQNRKRPDRASAQERRIQSLRETFPVWQNAIPDACKAMFSLNRYAKHGTCSRKHQKIIYDLKNDLVKLLYELGFADRVGIHIVRKPEKRCWNCDGDGWGWAGNDCERCDGTGIYDDGVREFVVFSFLIGETRYTWHQPDHLVGWDFTVTEGESAWEQETSIKPIEMKKRDFAAAKDLIRYVLYEDVRQPKETTNPTGN